MQIRSTVKRALRYWRSLLNFNSAVFSASGDLISGAAPQTEFKYGDIAVLRELPEPRRSNRRTNAENNDLQQLYESFKTKLVILGKPKSTQAGMNHRADKLIAEDSTTENRNMWQDKMNEEQQLEEKLLYRKDNGKIWVRAFDNEQNVIDVKPQNIVLKSGYYPKHVVSKRTRELAKTQLSFGEHEQVPHVTREAYEEQALEVKTRVKVLNVERFGLEKKNKGGGLAGAYNGGFVPDKETTGDMMGVIEANDVEDPRNEKRKIMYRIKLDGGDFRITKAVRDEDIRVTQKRAAAAAAGQRATSPSSPMGARGGANAAHLRYAFVVGRVRGTGKEELDGKLVILKSISRTKWDKFKFVVEEETGNNFNQVQVKLVVPADGPYQDTHFSVHPENLEFPAAWRQVDASKVRKMKKEKSEGTAKEPPQMLYRIMPPQSNKNTNPSFVFIPDVLPEMEYNMSCNEHSVFKVADGSCVGNGQQVKKTLEEPSRWTTFPEFNPGHYVRLRKSFYHEQRTDDPNMRYAVGQLLKIHSVERPNLSANRFDESPLLKYRLERVAEPYNPSGNPVNVLDQRNVPGPTTIARKSSDFILVDKTLDYPQTKFAPGDIVVLENLTRENSKYCNGQLAKVIKYEHDPFVQEENSWGPRYLVEMLKACNGCETKQSEDGDDSATASGPRRIRNRLWSATASAAGKVVNRVMNVYSALRYGSKRRHYVPTENLRLYVPEDARLGSKELTAHQEESFAAQSFHNACRDLLLTLEDGNLWKQMAQVQDRIDPVLMIDRFAFRIMKEVNWRFTTMIPLELRNSLQKALEQVVKRASIYATESFRALPSTVVAASSGEQKSGTEDADAEVQLQLEVHLEVAAELNLDVEQDMRLVTETAPEDMEKDLGFGLPELNKREREYVEKVSQCTTLLANESLTAPKGPGQIAGVECVPRDNNASEASRRRNETPMQKPMSQTFGSDTFVPWWGAMDQQTHDSTKMLTLMGDKYLNVTFDPPGANGDPKKRQFVRKASHLQYVTPSDIGRAFRLYSRDFHPDKLGAKLERGEITQAQFEADKEKYAQVKRDKEELFPDPKDAEKMKTAGLFQPGSSGSGSGGGGDPGGNNSGNAENAELSKSVTYRASQYLQSANLFTSGAGALRKVQELLYAFKPTGKGNWKQAGWHSVFKQPIFFSQNAAHPWKRSTAGDGSASEHPERFLGPFEQPLNKAVVVREMVLKPMVFDLALEIDLDLHLPKSVKHGANGQKEKVEEEDRRLQVKQFYQDFKANLLYQYQSGESSSGHPLKKHLEEAFKTEILFWQKTSRKLEKTKGKPHGIGIFSSFTGGGARYGRGSAGSSTASDSDDSEADQYMDLMEAQNVVGTDLGSMYVESSYGPHATGPGGDQLAVFESKEKEEGDEDGLDEDEDKRWRGLLSDNSLKVSLTDLKWEESPDRRDYEETLDQGLTALKKGSEKADPERDFKSNSEVFSFVYEQFRQMWGIKGTSPTGTVSDGQLGLNAKSELRNTELLKIESKRKEPENLSASSGAKSSSVFAGLSGSLFGSSTAVPDKAAQQADTHAPSSAAPSHLPTSIAKGPSQMDDDEREKLDQMKQERDYRVLWLQFSVQISEHELSQLHKAEDTESELMFRFATKMRKLLGFGDDLGMSLGAEAVPDHHLNLGVKREKSFIQEEYEEHVESVAYQKAKPWGLFTNDNDGTDQMLRNSDREGSFHNTHWYSRKIHQNKIFDSVYRLAPGGDEDKQRALNDLGKKGPVSWQLPDYARHHFAESVRTAFKKHVQSPWKPDSIVDIHADFPSHWYVKTSLFGSSGAAPVTGTSVDKPSSGSGSTSDQKPAGGPPGGSSSAADSIEPDEDDIDKLLLNLDKDDTEAVGYWRTMLKQKAEELMREMNKQAQKEAEQKAREAEENGEEESPHQTGAASGSPASGSPRSVGQPMRGGSVVEADYTVVLQPEDTAERQHWTNLAKKCALLWKKMNRLFKKHQEKTLPLISRRIGIHGNADFLRIPHFLAPLIMQWDDMTNGLTDREKGMFRKVLQTERPLQGVPAKTILETLYEINPDLHTKNLNRALLGKKYKDGIPVIATDFLPQKVTDIWNNWQRVRQLEMKEKLIFVTDIEAARFTAQLVSTSNSGVVEQCHSGEQAFKLPKRKKEMLFREYFITDNLGFNSIASSDNKCWYPATGALELKQAQELFREEGKEKIFPALYEYWNFHQSWDPAVLDHTASTKYDPEQIERQFVHRSPWHTEQIRDESRTLPSLHRPKADDRIWADDSYVQYKKDLTSLLEQVGVVVDVRRRAVIFAEATILSRSAGGLRKAIQRHKVLLGGTASKELGDDENNAVERLLKHGDFKVSPLSSAPGSEPTPAQTLQYTPGSSEITGFSYANFLKEAILVAENTHLGADRWNLKHNPQLRMVKKHLGLVKMSTVDPTAAGFHAANASGAAPRQNRQRRWTRDEVAAHTIVPHVGWWKPN
ncbi:unnamed protein product [Amoebophrya sp. A120]|nr:unnamed protein product [Amoebophrya sp. A120]|eukprot:GSA120T00014687001.1